MADDFLSSTYLASTAPVLLAPAMNTTMWQHPATRRNLLQPAGRRRSYSEPDDGEMACGTIGPGRLSEPARIVNAALDILAGGRPIQEMDFNGERVLITVGATREEIDPRCDSFPIAHRGKWGFAGGGCAETGAIVTV